MNSSKTFRLFISSTFSDFKKEREVLQKDVFPHIKEYALSKGYTFQPIDLRWGVSSEAQLDQKTLELCLDEVRSCKSYPHPNFLLMLGDRYGWVPLPYAIEKDEFELISSHIRKNDKKDTLIYEGKVSKEKWFGSDDEKGLKKLLDESENNFTFRNVEEFVDKNDNSEKVKFILNREIQSSKFLAWYKLDENQLPASYILKERQDEYEEYDIWVAEENTLREVLQTAVENSCINKDKGKRSKYFTSATEAEIIEGIVSYKDVTKNQEQLSKEAKKIDSKHVFGFLRNITSEKEISDIFVGSDNEKATKLKKNIKKIISKNNILDIDVEIEYDRLNENYLKIKVLKNDKESLGKYLKRVKEEYGKTFEYCAVEFLKRQIDKQKTENLNLLKIENNAQEYYLEQKKKDFLETISLRTLLKNIAEYIDMKEGDNQPFVIHGSSGSGKSSLLAQAIEEAKKHSSKKILYRFVGATPNSNSSKEILTSIIKELEKDVKHEVEKEKGNSDFLSLDTPDMKETFEEFSYRIRNKINNLKDEVVIFIDAVDQLTNEEQFLWLPNELPANVKIVISVLDDEKYEDTQYFKTLKNNKIGTQHLIPKFNKPGKLLRILLCKQDRTIQKEQMKYFLKQYRRIKTPLHVTVAAQEMKHWKSYNDVKDSTTKDSQSLANTQKDIIGEFIKNLSELYHHNKVFVQKVLGYIYASKDGLSESELLQLIATDEEFVKQMAPETWHENPTKELPIVHWSRLYTQLKPFLSSKSQDGEELMYFFHREFEDVIKNLSSQKKEHESIIKATQTLIEKNQNKSFNENRWGKLYITLGQEWVIRYYYLSGKLGDPDLGKEYSLFEKDFMNFIINLTNNNWIEHYLKRLTGLSNNNFSTQVIVNNSNVLKIDDLTLQFFDKQYFLVAKDLYEKNEIWFKAYIESVLGYATQPLHMDNSPNVVLNILFDAKDELEKKISKDNLKEEIFIIENYLKILKNILLIYNRTDPDVNELAKVANMYRDVSFDKLYKYDDNDKIKFVCSSLMQTIAIVYNRIGYSKEAFSALENSLHIRTELYENDEITVKLYLNTISTFVNIIIKNKEKLEELIKNYQINILLDKVGRNIQMALNNTRKPSKHLRFTYIQYLNVYVVYTKELKQGIKCVVCENSIDQAIDYYLSLYEEQPEVYSNYFVMLENIFDFLSKSYSYEKNLFGFKELIDKELKLIDKLREIDQDQALTFEKYYIERLGKVLLGCSQVKDDGLALKIFEKSLKFYEKLYGKDSKEYERANREYNIFKEIGFNMFKEYV